MKNLYTQLTEGERNQIYALIKGGKGNNEIARLLGRSSGTISREIRRNTGGARIQAPASAKEGRRKKRKGSLSEDDERVRNLYREEIKGRMVPRTDQ